MEDAHDPETAVPEYPGAGWPLGNDHPIKSCGVFPSAPPCIL